VVNLKSISHRCHPILVAFVRELTKETINLPLGFLQGGTTPETPTVKGLVTRRASGSECLTICDRFRRNPTLSLRFCLL